MNIKDKVRGIVFGVALGDALGGPLEFMNQSAILSKYGLVDDMVGGGWLDLEPGETTDDTAMTISVIKGVLDNWGSPISKIGEQFISWFDTKPKDIGITTKHALESFKAIGNWQLAMEKAHKLSGERSAGNGTLMRCTPIAFFYKDEYEKMIEMTIAQSKLTHYDPLCAEACCINNHIILELLNGKELNKSIQIALDKYDLENRYRDCLEGVITYKDLKPTGFVVDTLRCALYCLLNTEDFFDAVVMAVNLGGDADTIGAITGGIAGACYGYESLPAIWVYQLKCFNELDELCKDSLQLLRSR